MQETSLVSRKDRTEPESEQKSRFLNRRLAAAYVGVTIGLFEKMIRDGLIPQPAADGDQLLWDTVLLDRTLDALRHRSAKAPGAPDSKSQLPASSRGNQKRATVFRILPDREWFEQHADLVARVRNSMPSQNEISLLLDFKAIRSNEINMFGFYRSFEALMARGYVMETARSGPSSRPLVTYRLTDEGARNVASLELSRKSRQRSPES